MTKKLRWKNPNAIVSCDWLNNNLNNPNKCLIIMPEDFHWFDNFSKDSIILVIASEYFEKSDYLYEKK